MSRMKITPQFPVLLAVILVVLLGSIRPSQPSQAAPGATYSITVDTTDDHPEDNLCTGAASDCSLRGAISYANATTAGSVINIILPDGTYYLALEGPGDNTNATGDLDVISRTITLTGAGTATSIIHGMDDDRVLDNNAGDLTLEHLTITHGLVTAGGGGGGGILNRNNSTLHLDDVVIDHNVVEGADQFSDIGGGIFSKDDLVINNSTVKNNSACYGGGIATDDDLLSINDTDILLNTAISDGNCGRGGGVFVGYYQDGYYLAKVLLEGNQAEYGGGLINYGSVAGVILESTFHNNTGFEGGGLYNNGILTINRSLFYENHASAIGGLGGGVSNRDMGDLTIMNSTISGNDAYNAGGYISTNGSVTTLNHCTLADNTITSDYATDLYLSLGSDVSIHNTIVAGTGPKTVCFVSDPGVTITDLGYNLSSDHSCLFSTSAPYYDLIDTPPSLGPLQDNGGPTFTRAMLAMSLGLDMADPNSSLSVDQRNYFRPINWAGNGARSDIGAFEWNSFPISLLDKLFHLPLIMKPAID